MAADCSVSSHACGHRAKEGAWALTEGRGLDLPGDRSPRAPKAESCLPQFIGFLHSEDPSELRLTGPADPD